MKTYRIYLDEKMKEAVMIALGKSAWECEGTTAYKTYRDTYDEIKQQLKEQEL